MIGSWKGSSWVSPWGTSAFGLLIDLRQLLSRLPASLHPLFLPCGPWLSWLMPPQCHWGASRSNAHCPTEPLSQTTVARGTLWLGRRFLQEYLCPPPLHNDIILSVFCSFF